MEIPFADLKAQHFPIRNELDQAISDVIDTTAFVRGQYVESFESEFSALIGAENCIGCGNGTDAIFIALKALGVGPGDEVITTAMSWISTSETITLTGAKVVFVDVDKKTFTIDPEKIEEKITDRTKAIIPVHLYGQPADMTKIMAIAKTHKLFVIEDCAQAHMAMHSGRVVGTFGDFGTFSFYPGKNLGAFGDAGAILTDQSELASRARRYANHGSLVKHDHEIEGINSRLDGIQAAVLLVKMKYLQRWNAKRREAASLYGAALADIKQVKLPFIEETNDPVFHLYVIRSEERFKLRQFLKSRNIATGIHYPAPLPFLRAYEYLGLRPEEFPVAAELQSTILSLPMYPELTGAQVKWVANSIREFFQG